MEIEILEDYKIYKSIIDFWVKYKDGREEFQEVKYSAELTGSDKSSLRSQEQIRRQKLWCKQNGINHSIQTENDISVGEFTIRNYNVMHSKIRRLNNNPEKYRSNLIEFIADKKFVRIKDIVSANIFPTNQELTMLSYYYYLGITNMNIDSRPIDNATEVSLCQQRN